MEKCMYLVGMKRGLLLGIFAFLTSLTMSGCSPLAQGWSAFEKDDFAEAKAKWATGEEAEVKALTKRADAAIAMVKLDKSATANLKKGRKTKANQDRITIVYLDKWSSKKDNWTERSKLIDGIMKASWKVRVSVQKKQQALYSKQINCGKDHFNKGEYKPAKKCFASADQYNNTYKYLPLKTEDVSALVDASTMALEIQAEIEREMAAAKRKAAAEAERMAAEHAVLMKAAADKKAEEERIAAEKKRLWELFLKKGKPFKPLVAVVGIPIKGTGYITKKGGRMDFQGAARLPTMKKKRLRAQDIYSLEIVVPKDYTAVRLANHPSRGNNLLKAGMRIGDKRHYLTDDYAGKRFYLKVMNKKGKNPRFAVEATIYKTPVTN